jgi:hypothetical protein
MIVIPAAGAAKVKLLRGQAASDTTYLLLKSKI